MFTEFVVIIPKNVKEVLPELERILKPYNNEENLTKAVIEECYCGDKKIAEEETRKEVSKELANLRESKKKEGTEDVQDELVKFEQMMKSQSDYKKLFEERIKLHPLYGKVDPNCQACAGLGTYTLYDNPNGKFDYWDIGYGWDVGLKTISYCEKDWLTTNDIIMVDDIPDDLIQGLVFLPIVTPDGFWIESTEPWERNQSKIDNAVKNMKETLAKYPFHQAIRCKGHY